MKNLVTYCLTLVAVGLLLFAGLDGLVRQTSYGMFFTFVGVFTTIGLGLDVTLHLKEQGRRNNLRKLGRRS